LSVADLEIASLPLDEIGENLLNAIDAASDQDGRTWITADGKQIARIVTVEDGERLDKLDELAGKHEPRIIHDAQIVSWGPVADAPWHPS
jgi:hypothetical protein